MDKVRWGILSTAKIGVEKVIPAMQHCKYAEVKAIASRTLTSAQSAAAELRIEQAYASYDELLADPSIQAIYNPLPNHMHVPWTIKAIEAGKHVLCEKPIALSVEEANTLQESLARHPGVKVMEAFMYRFHPQWQRALELVRSGALGDIQTIQTFFSFFNDDPNNIRHSPEMGGGGVMDIGCYPISLSRYIYEREPLRLLATLNIDPEFGVDRSASAIMDFGGPTSTFTCSMEMSPFQRTQIVGNKGRIELEIPFNAPPQNPTRIWVSNEQGTVTESFSACDQYTEQGDVFSQAIINDEPVPTPLSDAISNMQVIEAVFESDKSGGWVAL
ncbi:NAD-binding protein [Chromatiales bacterium (ex Bugula neritina AB1)]|nr:NAD-binding protein [Chromatiales bacterium (ex Bugula neritina AB1)]